jgi:CubicO group peptidase (beta-lactamase class C family)
MKAERHMAIRSLLCVLLLSLALGFPPVPAEEGSGPAPDLNGVWKAYQHDEPRVGGTLIIRRDGAAWAGDIANLSATARAEDGRLMLDFGPQAGRFEGRIGPGERLLGGHWIQPPGQLRYFSRYAIPVAFQEHEGYWQGQVRPLEDFVRLYLVTHQTPDGKALALIEQETNVGRLLHLNGLTIAADGTAELRGRYRWEDTDHAVASGHWDDEQRRLSLWLPRYMRTFDFHPLDDTDSGYAAWSPRRGTYRYHPPPALDDGWAVADLRQSGLDPAPIEALVQRIISTPLLDPADPSVHALLIAHRGKLVFEEYFQGFDRNSLHDTRSASKSLTGTLVGLAMHAGVPVKLSDKLYRGLPAYRNLAAGDPGKQAITLEHVITMSTGLACNDWDGDSPGGEDRMQEQTAQPDWYRFILELPLQHPPGTVAAYCSGGMSLAGGMLAQATSKTGAELIHDYFAAPLDIDAYQLNLMPTGQAYMGGGLRLRARDFMKLGQLMLDGGTWNGQRLLAPEFVAAALAPQQELGGMHYGYGWWRKTYTVDGVDYPVFFAGGNGGQYIIGVPDLELLIVMFGGAYSTAGTFAGREDFLPNYLIPAAAGPNTR